VIRGLARQGTTIGLRSRRPSSNGVDMVPLRVGVMSSVVPIRAGPTRPHRVSRYRQVCAEQAAYAPSGARVCPPLISDGHLKVLDAAPFSKRRGLPGRLPGGRVQRLVE
jgi:hypothetical protein